MVTPAPSLDLIERILREQGFWQTDDIIFVGGSVADGLATPSSDIDVFVIRNGLTRSNGELHLVPLPIDQAPIDLEVWGTAEVQALLHKLKEVGAAAATNHRAFMRLTEEERDFLHCLTTAIPVYNKEMLLKLQIEVDSSLLSQLSLARALVGVTNSQTDLLGWLASDDWQSVGAACQRLLDFSAAAMLAAAGCTHVGGKWLTALLRNCFSGKRLPPRLLGGSGSLVDHFYALQLRPSCSEGALTYAQGCVNFSNFAVVYAQTINCGLDDPLRQIFWLPERPSPPSDCQFRPRLSCAAQIRFDSGRWYLLHVGREMFQVNATAVGMMLLLDGRTTEQEMLDILEKVTSPNRIQLSGALRDLLMFLDNANLLGI